MPTRKAYVDSPHGQIHLRRNTVVAGSRPLVCLHATAYSSQTFQPLLDAYDGIRSVIAIDAPGYGGSDAPSGPIDLAGYAEAIGTAIEACCDGPVDLLGYHTGAYIAAQLALSDRDLVAGLVLIGVPYFQALGFEEWRDRLSARHVLGDGLDQFAERWNFLVANRAAGLTLARGFENFVDELRAWPNGWWAHEAMFAWDADAMLPQVAQPVLIINPAGHLAVASRAAAGLLPDVRIYEMPDLEGAIFERAPARIRDAIEGIGEAVAAFERAGAA